MKKKKVFGKKFWEKFLGKILGKKIFGGCAGLGFRALKRCVLGGFWVLVAERSPPESAEQGSHNPRDQASRVCDRVPRLSG